VQEAARLRPDYADAFTGMGASLKELKRMGEAEACFERVVRLRPGCALSLGNLAGAYYEQGGAPQPTAALPSAILIPSRAGRVEPQSSCGPELCRNPMACVSSEYDYHVVGTQDLVVSQ
jgi:Flp pilus assembly protein TadD